MAAAHVQGSCPTMLSQSQQLTAPQLCQAFLDEPALKFVDKTHGTSPRHCAIFRVHPRVALQGKSYPFLPSEANDHCSAVSNTSFIPSDLPMKLPDGASAKL